MPDAAAVADARAALDAAGERQRKIDSLIAEKQKVLDALAEQRANKGRGRPNAQHASRKAAAEASIARLQRGLLPGESEPVRLGAMSNDQLRTSAAQHPQHHAAAGTAPAGRSAGSGASAGGLNDSGGADDDGGEGGADGDDDEEDASFHQFYAVSSNQKAFNITVAKEYMKKGSDHKVVRIEPDNLLASGCKKACVGLGAVHICAPHLHLGLPLPPCPKHGWASVDRKKLRTRGFCPARRVYAPTVDEWLVGVVICCEMCKDEKREAEERLAELEPRGGGGGGRAV